VTAAARLDPGTARRLVADHVSIRVGRTSRRQRFQRLADVVLDFCYDPSWRGPAGCLVLEAFVADERLAA
jgi:hypothetical protein